MKGLPHHYIAKASGEPEGNLSSEVTNLSALSIAPPAQFGGPGDQWSPEDLLMASVANCLILSFRAITKISRFEWVSIECESEGELDKVERKIQFTKINSKVRLVVSEGADEALARKLVQKAEDSSLISNSLNAKVHLHCKGVF